ncbi:transglutaminase domain-containing protein [Pyrococcus sp. ST04]|uniref:transglutaminase domain-containing protein n=1 Tax=Pyrococcus sp. ST04 TaxID=1183377 RepID=UPI0002605AA9|nr:transglutaminase domain-containing protein [Pyrococcus sp. ST04]AFK22106.1 hypothetical protein Py04_0504 [Pyrococcus sp. ST04]
MMRNVIAAVILAIIGFMLISSATPLITSLKPPVKISQTNFQATPKSLDLRENLYRAQNTGNTTVMIVWEERGNVEYLRSNVYSTYMDGKWVSDEEGFAPVPPMINVPLVPHNVSRDLVRVKMLKPLVAGNLYTALYTERVSIPFLYNPEYNLFRPKDYPVKEYEFSVIKYGFPEDVLKNASVEKIEKYLQVPKLDERVKELALNITEGKESPFEKAKAIEEYLKKNYEYDLNAPPAPPGIDPVTWFLFYSRKGVCLDFNTAFVILARLNGIPARLVTGFHVEPRQGKQEVRLNQAHAWAEVYFKDVGWVIFDATPPQHLNIPSTGSESPQLPIPTNESKELCIVSLNPRTLVIPVGNSGEARIISNQPVKVEVESSPLPVKIINKTVRVEGVDVGHYKINLLAKCAKGEVPLTLLVTVAYRTKTDILSLPDTVTPGEAFVVEGTVKTQEGLPVPAGEVVIELRRNKNEKGVIIGRGNVTDGRFSIKCKAPRIVGEFHVVAVYRGYDIYYPSTSDPTIKIVDKAEIYIQSQQKLVVGRVARISGFLGTANGVVLKSEPIKVLVDGREYSTVITKEDGSFFLNLILPNPGRHNITLVYEGNEWVEGTTKSLLIISVSVSLRYPREVFAGREFYINGTILGIQEGKIVLEGDFGYRTIKPGKFSIKLKADESMNGLYNFTLKYNGTSLAKGSIWVRQDVIAKVEGLGMVAGKEGEITVFLRYSNGTPVKNVPVTLMVFGKVLINRTNERGVSSFTVLAPKEKGKYEGYIMYPVYDHFRIEDITVKVYSRPPYVYALTIILSLALSLGSFKVASMLLTPKISLDRDPPVYYNQEEILVNVNKRASLSVDGKDVGKGKEFRLKLPPGKHEISAKKMIFSSRINVYVFEDPSKVAVKIFNECLDGRPNKTARELFGVNRIVEIFEKARYSLEGIKNSEFLEFLRDISGRCSRGGESKE